MNVTVTYKTEAVIDIKPGDKVLLTYRQNGKIVKERKATVVRLTETSHHLFAVFNRGEWRPVSTYNKTWWKVE
jgi:hypothetical protein